MSTIHVALDKSVASTADKMKSAQLHIKMAKTGTLFDEASLVPHLSSSSLPHKQRVVGQNVGKRLV